MELYEYIMIAKRKQKIFWVTLALFVFVALVWQGNQGPRYGATLLLNISRSGSQVTTDYTYDGFYRLQADERFADTVVRWIGSPRGAEDILRDVGIDATTLGADALAGFFHAGRLSSQMIRVEYDAKDAAQGERIATSVTGTMNRYAEKLNQEAKDPSWFAVKGEAPVIRDARVPLWKVLSIAVAVGMFFGFWLAMFAHYWEMQREKSGERR